MAQKFHRSGEGMGEAALADRIAPQFIKPDEGREDAASETIDDDRLAQIIEGQEAAATTFARANLSSQRANALKNYLGEPFGNEVEGRSSVVSTDVFEAVEGMLPSLLEIFLSSNRIAECEAYGPEDEAEARQQTEVVNHILFKQNNAALIFYTWFKDALIQKTGIVKTYYETEDEYRIEQYRALTDDEMIRLLSQDHIEPLERTQYELLIDGHQVPVNDVRVRVRTNRDKICIQNVAPENFLVSVRQSSIDLEGCEFCAHREQKTASDLLEMGVEQSFLDEIGDDETGADVSEERIARDIYSEATHRDPHNEDPSLREYWVSDGVILVDTDGDGIAELRHFIKIGRKIWLNEETDYNPFSVICPILLPHQFHGLSIADITTDVQFTKSVLWRQMLDNLYLTNNPQKGVVEGQVELGDLLTSRPGGIIRMRAPGAVVPIETPFVAKDSFPMLEYWDSVKENRTGVTRYNQGTDADSLNKTAHGIQSILSQSMKRLEMVARLFAETGVKDLVRKILHCVARSGMKQVIVKLTNGYVPIDPREWRNQYNVTINVGLGTGTKDRQIQMLTMIGAKQLELKQTGRGYLVSEMNDFALASKLAEAAGFKNPEVFFTDPRAVNPEAKQPPPDPEILKLQQNEKLKVMDMQVTAQQTDKKMMNERWIAAMEATKDQETKITVAQLAKQAQESAASINADTTKRTKMADAVLRDHEIRSNADIEVFRAGEERAKPQEAVAAVSDVMGKYMEQLIQAVIQGNEQNRAGFEAMAAGLQELKQIALAPRTRIKDKTGKMTGVEIQGYGKVPVQ